MGQPHNTYLSKAGGFSDLFTNSATSKNAKVFIVR